MIIIEELKTLKTTGEINTLSGVNIRRSETAETVYMMREIKKGTVRFFRIF
jgi:hypothetical protein